MDPTPYTGPGADRDPRPRRPHHAGERRTILRPGTCPTPPTSRPATPRVGTWYDFNSRSRRIARSRETAQLFQYPNDQRAGHPLVSRPHPGHDPRRTSTRAGRASTSSAAAQTILAAGRCPARRPSWATRPGTTLLRDPDRHPGPLLQRRRLAVLPGQPRFLRGPGARPAPDSLSYRIPAIGGAERRVTHLEPGVLRQHHGGERPHLAVPGGGAAALPLPLPERLQVPLPDPRTQPATCPSGRSVPRAASCPRR